MKGSRKEWPTEFKKEFLGIFLQNIPGVILEGVLGETLKKSRVRPMNEISERISEKIPKKMPKEIHIRTSGKIDEEIPVGIS